MVLIAVIALIVLGPERLPEAARALGRVLADLKRATRDMKDEFEAGIADPEGKASPPPPRRELDAPKTGPPDSAARP